MVYMSAEKQKVMYSYIMGSTQIIESGIPSDILTFIAMAIKERIDPNLVLLNLIQHTNLCVYHTGGACIHGEDCDWNHSQEYDGVMDLYVRIVNEDVDKRHQFKKPQPT
jgi:hypothetical protein